MAVGGAAPVNPRPRSARGGAVFFMVSPCCRVAGVAAAAFVDKITLYVDFICIFADKFVTLHYSYKVS